MIRPRSRGWTLAISSAWRAAATAISEVFSPGATTWRSRMPVRARIHSSLVSTMRSSSALVITREGTYFPQPTIFP